MKLAVIMGSLMLSLVLSLSLFTDIAGQEEQYPTADAGPDQSVNIGEIVVLNATGSFDPNGKIVSYAWGIEDSDDEAPAVSLNGQNTSIATFTVPMIVGNVSSNSYLFDLTVTDNSGFIGSDTTKVIVKGPGVDKHL